MPTLLTLSFLILLLQNLESPQEMQIFPLHLPHKSRSHQEAITSPLLLASLLAQIPNPPAQRPLRSGTLTLLRRLPPNHKRHRQKAELGMGQRGGSLREERVSSRSYWRRGEKGWRQAIFTTVHLLMMEKEARRENMTRDWA
jgi:hypothetical protein